MHLRVTTLAENTATKMDMLAEHGFSMLVEIDDLWIMLDTGQTGTAVHNARAMGIDLSRVNHLVLSHGHLDHTGGLVAVLAETGPVVVHGHKDIWSTRFGIRDKTERPRYTGLPFVRERLEALGATFKLAEGFDEIVPGVMTTGSVPRTTSYEKLDADLVVPGSEGWRQDPILDDQSLVIKTPKGLVVLSGCAHSGIVNTLNYARKVSGVEKIYAVMGGTHLGPAAREQVDETIAALRGFRVEKLGVSHCTGLPAAARLAAEFGEHFFFNNVGTVTEL